MATAMTMSAVNVHDAAIIKAYATGAAAIDHYLTVDESGVWRLGVVRLHLSAAPTTSEDFVITVDSVLGATYDTMLYSVDLSASSVVDLVLDSNDFGVAQDLSAGDKLSVTYTNTDTRTWSAEILLEAV